MDALSAFAPLLEQLGFPLLILVIVLWSGARGDWVFGWAYRRIIADVETMRADRDMWRDLALRGTDLAERIADGVRRP